MPFSQIVDLALRVVQIITLVIEAFLARQNQRALICKVRASLKPLSCALAFVLLQPILWIVPLAI